MVNYYHATSTGTLDYWWDLRGSLKFNLLISFLDLWRRGEYNVVVRIKEEIGGKLMIDSGAYTFLFGAEKDTAHEYDFDEYFSDYLRFLVEYRDYVDVYVELDLQQLVGEEKVEEWRRMFWENGLKPVYVWHYEDLDEIGRWLERTDYIAFATEEENWFDVMNDVLRLHPGTKIHVLAKTISPEVFEWGVTSCDSSVATISGANAEFIVFKDGRLTHSTRVWDDLAGFLDQVEMVREFAEEKGIDLDSMVERIRVEEHLPTLMFFNVIVMEYGIEQMRKEFGLESEEQESEKPSGQKMKKKKVKKRVEGFSCAVCKVADGCKFYDGNTKQCPLLIRRVEDWRVRRVSSDWENAMLKLINERIMRYERLRIFEEISGTVNREATKLEDGIADLITKYLMLKEKRANEPVITDDWAQIMKEVSEK